MNKISCYTPIMDADFKFISTYLENIKDCKIVDEIIFIYTGKIIDFSTEILKSDGINIKFFNYSVDIPYMWPEGKIRNFAIKNCKNEWILPLDIDEVIDENLHLLDLSKPCIYGFQFIPFWYDLQTIRISVPKDNHWYPLRVNRLYHKSLIKYNEDNNHSFYNFNINDFKGTSLQCYHLHYVDQFNDSILKPRDNRSGDFQKYENLELDSKGILLKKEDYFALNTPENIEKYYECKTIKYEGKYPKCLQKYII